MTGYTGSYVGFKENAELHAEQVVFPALGASIAKEMQVLHISNAGKRSSGVTYYYPLAVNPHSIFENNNISTEYTIVSRIKMDEDGLGRDECLFKIGYNASAKQGMYLALAKSPASSGVTDIGSRYIKGRCTPNSEGSDSSYQFAVRIPTNTWVDIAAVVGNGKLRIGIATPESSANHDNNPTIYFAETPMWTDNGLSSGDHYRLFCYSGQTAPATSSSADQTCFIGSVQQLAIWRRALSDEEVMEAFGMPRPARFRTGFDNGSSNEFGGSRSGSSQEIDGLGSWQNIANTMETGDTWTVNFTALRDEAGLPQIFSLKSLRGSVVAQIEPILTNASCNTSLGVRRVMPNGRTFWPVPADLITAGANTLIIKRKDGGAGDFKMDAMELGGSLGVGTEDANITDGRTAPDRNPTGVPSAADPNLQHWSQGLQPYTGASNVHFRVWVDSDVVNVNACSSRFWTQVRCYDRDGYSIQGDESASLCVNGVEKITHGPVKSWQPLELNFAPGELRAGWNDIEFKSAPYDTCHWYIRYYRFETVLSRGFSIPPYGTWISFR